MTMSDTPTTAPPPYSLRSDPAFELIADDSASVRLSEPLAHQMVPVSPLQHDSISPTVPIISSAPGPHRATGFMAPKLLPSPWEKASKSRVRNFREGVREGGKSAWAEIREGMKAPVGLTWDGVKQAGPLGLVGGAVCGAIHLGLCPISATIVFLNHSSRGIVRGRRARIVKAELSSFQALGTEDIDITPSDKKPSFTRGNSD